MPHGAVYVGRPSKWGNPFQTAEQFRAWLERGAMLADDRRYRILRDLGELRGKDLACWCPLDAPCHADVLLELANAPAKARAPKSTEVDLCRLADALVEDILNASDEDILAEVKQDGDDPAAIAAEVQALFAKVKADADG